MQNQCSPLNVTDPTIIGKPTTIYEYYLPIIISAQGIACFWGLLNHGSISLDSKKGVGSGYRSVVLCNYINIFEKVVISVQPRYLHCFSITRYLYLKLKKLIFCTRNCKKNYWIQNTYLHILFVIPHFFNLLNISNNKKKSEVFKTICTSILVWLICINNW